MKTTFRLFQILLLMCGVFGEDEEKTFSVIEGQSVTLNPDPTKMQGFVQIVWRFGEKGPRIAQIYKNKISYDNEEIFRNRLQLNPTGSLTIKNIRTKHSSLYKAEIDKSEGQFYMNFRVTVYESPSVTGAGNVETKTVSVNEGDSGTLQTDITKLDGDELIVWRFGEEGKLISKSDIESKSPTLYDTDERFRDRLQLNDQTGSLTINNMKNTDSGFYTVKISSSKQMITEKFIVTVSGKGLSPASVAGIVVGFLLAFAAAAVMGFVYYRRKISELRNKYVTVIDGEYVILKTGLTEIQENNQILWYYGDHDLPIAKIKGGTEETPTYDDGPGGQFKDKLKLNEKTGDLIITNSIIEHDRLYKLQIRTDNGITSKRFWVTVKEKPVSLCEGKSVILYTGLPEIQENNQILWYCEDHYLPIAVIRGGTGESPTYDDGPDGKFKYKLKLDEKTGDLTITNTTAEHGGYYKLQIRTDNGITSKRFWVYVVEMSVTVIDGNSVTLKTGLPEIQKYNQILWVFNFNSTIAEISGRTGETHTYDDGPGKIFKDKLKLDDKTGDLTITNTTDEHDGVYELWIRTDNGTISKRVRVYVEAASVTVIEGDSATLKTGLTEIQKNNQILWYCGDHDILIAVIRGGTGESPKYNDGPDGKFKNKLKLNEKTGDLTITNTTAEHDGYYKLQISTDNGITSKGLRVIVKAKPVAVIEGDSVTLKTDLTELRKNNQILWMFRDFLIAEITGGTEENPTYDDGPGGRFKNRLTLDKKTGDLTITNTTAKHDGVYKLQIGTDNGITSKRFRVYVKEKSVPVIEGKSSTLNTGLPEIQISTDKGATSKRFNAFAEGKQVNESATVDMPLLEDPDGANEQEAMSSL